MGRRESLLPVLAAVGLLVVLAAALFWLRPAPSPGDAPGRAPDVSAAPDVPAPPQPAQPQEDVSAVPGYDGPVRTVRVWMDGWSHLTLGSSELSVVALLPDGTRHAAAPATLSPASLDEVVSLAASSPGVVTALAARMVRFDVLLRCDGGGCSSQRGDVHLGWVADPRLVPSLGEVYAGWGVGSGALHADVVVPQDAEMLLVSSPGWVASSRAVPAADDVALAAAFGVVFELEPNWVTGEGVWARQPYRLDTEVGVAPLSGVSSVFADGTAFWRGLAVAVPGAERMHPSVLTMLSSPTLGCNGALCVPARADVDIEVVASFTSRACPDPDFSGTSDLSPGSEALVAGSQLAVRARIDHPVRQAGVALPAPGEWPGHVPGGVGPYTGDAPLTSGEVVLGVQQVWLFVGDELTPHVAYSREVTEGGAALTADSWDGLSRLVARCR